MLADFYIPMLSYDMKIAVHKNHLVGKILYRSLVPSKKRRLCYNINSSDLNCLEYFNGTDKNVSNQFYCAPTEPVNYSNCVYGAYAFLGLIIVPFLCYDAVFVSWVSSTDSVRLYTICYLGNFKVNFL